MNNKAISIKIGWLLSFRLLTYVLISGMVLYWMQAPRFLNLPFFIYSLLTLALPVLIIVKRWVNIGFLLKTLPIVQILFEIIIELGIIYTTGNVNSAFSGLFILTIISAAFVTHLIGTLSIASAVSAGYAFVVWFGLYGGDTPGIAMRAMDEAFSSGDVAFYNIFLHILTFYLVAFISGYLVERLKIKDIQLENTSQALKKARLETDDILRHLNSGLFTIDRDGRIIFFNRAAEEILGYYEEDIGGKNFREIFGKRMPQLVENLNDVIINNRHNQRIEISIEGPDERLIPLGISTSLLREPDESIRGVIAIFQDLTETKKLEEKIREADRMAAVGELSAAIAHEIRNPLAAISGSVEVLKSDLDVSDENSRLLELIIKESNRLNSILSDFLMFARNQRSSFVKIELCRLISDVCEVVRHHSSFKKNIELSFSSEHSIVYIFGDEDQIKQILINLIVNACEALEGCPGKVSVKIVNEDDSPVIIVNDTGPGIPDEIRGEIFNPFYSTKKYGTGLGLAIVKRLAGNLNIDLELSSDKYDGTSFYLKFPTIQASGADESVLESVKA